MILLFRSYTSVKGQSIIFDTEEKTYKWTCSPFVNGKLKHALYMPTNKDLKELEKELIKEGFEEL